MRAPKRLYWVELTGGNTLSYRQRGGGKFTSREMAEERQAKLEYDGIETKLFQTQELEWSEVE